MRVKTLNTYLPPLVSVFLLVVGVVAGIALVQRPQDFREQAAPSTALSVSPSTQTASPGSNVTFSVVMNTGSNQVVGMDLVLNYDPAILQVNTISKGQGIAAFDSVIKNSIDNNTGKISYSLFSVDKTKAVSGSNIATLDINATVKAGAPAGDYSLTLATDSSVAAVSEGQNVVVSRVPGTLTVSTTAVTSTVTSAPTSTTAPTNPPSSGGGNNSGGSNSANPNPPVAAGKRGDLNGDGKINVLDLSILLSKFMKATGNSDLNNDGKTNILDLSILLSSWGK